MEDATLEIAKPGESVRIINHFEVMEPRVKVTGPGTAYPGRAGRPVDTVGQGRTHRLGGMALIVSYDGADEPGQVSGWVPEWKRSQNGAESEEKAQQDRRTVWTDHHFIDMSGPGAVLPNSATNNLCLSLRLSDHLDVQNQGKRLVRGCAWNAGRTGEYRGRTPAA